MGCKEILSWSFLAKILPAKKFSKTETDRFITETLKEKKTFLQKVNRLQKSSIKAEKTSSRNHLWLKSIGDGSF